MSIFRIQSVLTFCKFANKKESPRKMRKDSLFLRF